MSENNNVTKIMNNIKKQIQDDKSNFDVTSKNIISLASIKYQEKLSNLNSKNKKYIDELDSVISKEQNENDSDTNIEDFGENLIQANKSYDIQTMNKIETSKPKIIRKWVLKFRNTIQNEIRFALNPIVNKQIKFNIHITRSVNSLKKILDAIELKHQLRMDTIELKHQLRIDDIERHVNITHRKRIDDLERIVDVTQRKRIDDLEHLVDVTQRKRIDDLERIVYVTQRKRIDDLERLVDVTQRKRIDYLERMVDVDQRARIDIIDETVNVQQNRKFDILSIHNAFQNYLKRDPSDEELHQWLGFNFKSDPMYEQFMLIKNSDEAINIKKHELKLKGIILYDNKHCYKNIDGQEIHFNLKDKTYFEPFSKNELYEPEITQFLKNVLKKGMNVINIGANIGYHTLLAARQVGPKGKVFAFEPFPETAELLEKNVDVNGYKNVQIISMAVSDKTETSYLALKSDSGHNFVVSKPTNDYDTIEIPTTTIDDYFDNNLKIDFIIMDAEGYEPKILDGMKNILEKNPNIKILTEYNPHTLLAADTSKYDFLEKIEKLGFIIQRIISDGKIKNNVKDELLKIQSPNVASLLLIKS